MKATRLVNGFAGIILVLGKWDISGPKMLITLDLLKSFLFFKKKQNAA